MNTRSPRSRLNGWMRDAALMGAALILMGAAGYGTARLIERGAPRRAALSRDMERALADAVESSIRAGNEVIDTPEMNELTRVMQERLEEGLMQLAAEAEEAGDSRGRREGTLPEVLGRPDYDPEVRVLVADSDMVNAVAFPGNLVVLYTGLIRVMDGPDELAGVLAHEMGHCVANDARNALIREVGLSVLVSTASGTGAGELVSEVIRGAVRMRYGRRAEERADEFALALLAASDLDPAVYAGALTRLSEASGKAPEWTRYVDVHPAMDDRIAAAGNRAVEISRYRGSAAYRPIEADWEAVRGSLPGILEPSGHDG